MRGFQARSNLTSHPPSRMRMLHKRRLEKHNCKLPTETGSKTNKRKGNGGLRVGALTLRFRTTQDSMTARLNHPTKSPSTQNQIPIANVQPPCQVSHIYHPHQLITEETHWDALNSKSAKPSHIQHPLVRNLGFTSAPQHLHFAFKSRFGSSAFAVLCLVAGLV